MGVQCNAWMPLHPPCRRIVEVPVPVHDRGGVLETEELVVALDLGDRPELTRPGHSGSNSRAGGRGERPPRRQRTLSRGSRWARARAPRFGAGGLGRGAETVRTVVPVALLMSSPCRLRESGVPRGESSGRRGQAAALGAAAGRAWCVDVWGARGACGPRRPLDGVGAPRLGGAGGR